MADIAVINQPNPQHYLLFLVTLEGGNQFTLIVDDDTFPQNRIPLNPPGPFHDLTNIKMLGDHNGYQLFFGDDLLNQTKNAVIWNFTDHAVQPVAWIIDARRTVVGLSFRPDTPVPKLVKLWVDENDIHLGGWRVRVSESTLNEPEVWTEVDENNFHHPPFDVDCAKNCINGVMYFRARDRLTQEKFFITFDLDGGIVGDVHPLNPNNFHSLKVNGSLRLLEYHEHNRVCDVWAKGDGPEFFELHTVTNVRDGDVLAFRNNGQAVVKLRNDEVTNIGVYDPVLQQITINDVGINEMPHTSLYVTPYIGNAN